MSFEALHWAYEQPIKGKYLKPVLAALANRADESGRCFPSLRRIAFDVGCSLETVKKAVKWLEEKGYLTKAGSRRPDGGQSSNIYRLSLEAVAPSEALGVPNEIVAPPGHILASPLPSCGSPPSHILAPPMTKGSNEPSEEPKEETNNKPQQTHGGRIGKTTHL